MRDNVLYHASARSPNDQRLHCRSEPIDPAVSKTQLDKLVSAFDPKRTLNLSVLFIGTRKEGLSWPMI